VAPAAAGTQTLWEQACLSRATGRAAGGLKTLNITNTRERLLASSMICSVALVAFAATPALAQEAAAAASTDDAEVSEIVVTGSRIVRQDYVANSPIATVTGEQIVANADITLDTYLNTLPQINPAGTTTSNNPPNNGQANIDLRGLGANRNIVLIDGRRPMVSDNTLTVDINTIPQALIESIEVITGGAGATYGADAVAGAVNIKLKKNFEGVDLRAGYSNSTEFWDAKEYQFSAVVGGNFADDKGNAVIAFDRSVREAMYKNQRQFSQYATSTTSFYPDGLLFYAAGNAPSDAAINALFAQPSYGSNPSIVRSSGTLGFNSDGSLFYRGVFNDPRNPQNLRLPTSDPSINPNFYPDLYMYNFDYVNILTLPLDRKSFMSKLDYRFDNGLEVFASAGWTQYRAASALAPTPVPTLLVTPSIAPGLVIGSGAFSQLAVPVTNPFIPNDLRTLLNSRTGDNPGLAGAGANEAFLIRTRTVDIGLRQENYENTVVQYMAGLRGPIGDTGWKFEAYLSEGQTKIINTQTGNVDTARLEQLLSAPDGGASLCSGGYNPFGRNPISAACQDFLRVDLSPTSDYTQQIAQAYMTGNVVDLPAGPLAVVLGVEYRGFEYTVSPGPGASTISGFTVADPEAGTNSFKDFFAEALVPLVKDAPWAQTLELSLGYRHSVSEFADKLAGVKGDEQGSDAYKVELNWQPLDWARVRGSYQRAVRAPNFNELFASGNTAPQYFDPCSTKGVRRTGPNAAQMAALCAATGVGDVAGFVQTPGSQLTSYFKGNTDLEPERADTFTVGVVFSSPWEGQWTERLRASLDYYDIKVKDAIQEQNVNAIVADCYNYYGNNPTYSANFLNCQGIGRGGGEILQLDNPTGVPDASTGAIPFLFTNEGSIETSGFDFQLDWGYDWEWFGAPASLGQMKFNLIVSHLLQYENTTLSRTPVVDYAGTVAYFGAGLGQSFPKWRATAAATWLVDDFDVMVRTRFIGEMENRAAVEFPGETFTGTPATWYWDASAGWKVTDNVEVRLGVNNAFDQQPPQYAPNVQSGTDPSVFDVVGRRVFGQIRLRF
jgi:outer membrane receptor protein involved in Fe transport